MNTNTKPLLRSLIRELKLTNHTYKPLAESPIYQYIVKQFRANQVTTEQTCKARQESVHLADTYLCYMHSSRKSEALRKEYHARGERDVRATADMVGFKLPHDPK